MSSTSEVTIVAGGWAIASATTFPSTIDAVLERASKVPTKKRMPPVPTELLGTPHSGGFTHLSLRRSRLKIHNAAGSAVKSARSARMNAEADTVPN